MYPLDTCTSALCTVYAFQWLFFWIVRKMVLLFKSAHLYFLWAGFQDCFNVISNINIYVYNVIYIFLPFQLSTVSANLHQHGQNRPGQVSWCCNKINKFFESLFLKKNPFDFWADHCLFLFFLLFFFCRKELKRMQVSLNSYFCVLTTNSSAVIGLTQVHMYIPEN